MYYCKIGKEMNITGKEVTCCVPYLRVGKEKGERNLNTSNEITSRRKTKNVKQISPASRSQLASVPIAPALPPISTTSKPSLIILMIMIMIMFTMIKIIIIIMILIVIISILSSHCTSAATHQYNLKQSQWLFKWSCFFMISSYFDPIAPALPPISTTTKLTDHHVFVW